MYLEMVTLFQCIRFLSCVDILNEATVEAITRLDVSYTPIAMFVCLDRWKSILRFIVQVGDDIAQNEPVHYCIVHFVFPVSLCRNY